MKTGIKYKGVITDPRDGEAVAVEISTVGGGASEKATMEPADSVQSHPSSTVAADLAVEETEPVAMATGESPEPEPALVETQEVQPEDCPPETEPEVLDDGRPGLTDKYRRAAAALSDNYDRAMPVAEKIGKSVLTRYNRVAPVVADKYRKVAPVVADKYRKVAPVLADKYRQIAAMHAASQRPARRPRRRPPKNTGLKTRTARVPSIKVVTKR